MEINLLKKALKKGARYITQKKLKKKKKKI
jgi:hypothetical protein